MVAYRGNGARDMTSGVELFFISFVFVFIVITSVRVPPLSLRGYEGWATCGQNTLTGSPLASLTIHFFIFCSTFVFRPEIFVPPFLLGIFVPLDSRSAARCARAPQLAQSWDYCLGIFLLKFLSFQGSFKR